MFTTLLENAERKAILGIQQEVIDHLGWDSEFKTEDGDLYLLVKGPNHREQLVSNDRAIHYQTADGHDSIVLTDGVEDLIANLKSIDETGWCLD